MGKQYIILGLLIFILINTSNVASQEVISTTIMKVEVQCPPNSDNVYITRYFHISNNDLEETLYLTALKNRYVFGVSKKLNPILISSKDHYANIYQEHFENSGDLKIVDYYFPYQNIQIKPRDDYLIISKYEATANIIFKENDAKKLKFLPATIDNKELEEFKIIIPNCFGFKREFKDASPPPTSIEIIDNNIILSYDKSLLNSIINISSEFYTTTNIYDPAVRFNYLFDVFELVKYTITLFFGAFIGVILNKKLNSKKK